MHASRPRSALSSPLPRPRAARRLSCALLIALAMSLGACTSFSPPLQSTHHGAPERLREGDLELQGAVSGFASDGGSAPEYGQGRVGYGVRDWVAVEGGGTFARDLWAMAYAGPRVTLSPNRDEPIHAAADVELGLGLGAGGAIAAPPEGEQPSDPRPWNQRLAFGAYTGLGAGLHIHWFSVFARVRLQGSRADGLPASFWSSGVGGMQFRIKHTVDLFMAAGYFNLATRDYAQYAGLYEFGVAVHFDVRSLVRKRAQRRATRAGSTRSSRVGPQARALAESAGRERPSRG